MVVHLQMAIKGNFSKLNKQTVGNDEILENMH